MKDNSLIRKQNKRNKAEQIFMAGRKLDGKEHRNLHGDLIPFFKWTFDEWYREQIK